MNIDSNSHESLLPFMVVEALSSRSTSFDAMSVRMMDLGWAWLVCGRKLLVWKFKDSKAPSVVKTRRTLSPCFELQLAQSDLIHKAELVHVFFMPQNPNTSIRATTIPAALAISPEGTIRFWLNIANERYAESSVADMQGQEFCSLVPLSMLEYLIGTTTGSVFLLTIDTTSNDSKGVINCSSLAAPAGILSEISRRMTNLFFGPMTADANTETRRPLIAVPGNTTSSTTDKSNQLERPFYVMSYSFKLRHWSRTVDGPSSQNQLVKEWDLQNTIHRKLVHYLKVPESRSLNFWPVDMIVTKTNELLVLIVTLDTSRDSTINYSTCVFKPNQGEGTITSLRVLKSHSWNYTNESEEHLLALRFLERQASSTLCFMYDRKFLFLVQTDKDILDAVDYANQEDAIMGAGIVDKSPILFTQRDGLVCISPVVSNRSRLDDGNETTIQMDPTQTTFGPNMSQLSRAGTTQASIREEPMLIEIEDDDGDENNDQENKLARNSSQPHSRHEKDLPTLNKTNLETSHLSRTDQSTRYKVDEVSELIKENKELEWIQLIDTKQYQLASESLARLATESENLLDRKETLIALSKLAKLAE